MSFGVGQKAKVKEGSASARVIGMGVVTVLRVTNNGKTVFVKGEGSARWVTADELEPLTSEGTGA